MRGRWDATTSRPGCPSEYAGSDVLEVGAPVATVIVSATAVMTASAHIRSFAANHCRGLLELTGCIVVEYRFGVKLNVSRRAETESGAPTALLQRLYSTSVIDSPCNKLAIRGEV